MFSKELLKRAIPFLAAFALGILVAGFFVSVAAPNFNFRSERRFQRFEGKSSCHSQSRRERHRFKREKAERKRLQEAEFNGDLNLLVPPPPPLPPAAPNRVR